MNKFLPENAPVSVSVGSSTRTRSPLPTWIPLLARIWLFLLVSKTSPAPVVTMLIELAIIWPVPVSTTPPALVAIAIDPIFRTPPLAIVRLGTPIVAAAPATVPATVGATVSFNVNVPVRLNAPIDAIVFDPFNTASPAIVPMLTNVAAAMDPASVMPPALAPSATFVAPLTNPAIPMVPAFSAIFGAVTIPATFTLPVDVSAKLPPLTAKLPREAMVLVPVSVAPPATVPIPTRVAAKIEPVSTIPPALAPRATVPDPFKKPAMLKVPAFNTMSGPTTVPATLKLPVLASEKLPPLTLKLPRDAIVLVPVSVAPPATMPRLTKVAAAIEPASEMPPALAPSATVVAAFRKLAMPIVPAFSEILLAPIEPPTDRLPPSTKLKSPATTPNASKVPMLLVLVSPTLPPALPVSAAAVSTPPVCAIVPAEVSVMVPVPAPIFWAIV